jgi:DnaK suppressor protein
MLTQEQLNQFEEKLLNKKTKILRNLEETQRDINDVRDSELNDEGDYAAASIETAVDSAILEQQSRELREIELSLGKIKNGTYGVCEMCEEPVGFERLQVKPFARFCITCREINEKNKK